MPGSFAGTRDAYLEMVHPEDRDRVIDVVRHSIESGEDYSMEFRIVRSDGSVGWLEGRGQAEYDENGRPTQLFGVGIDITERVEMQMERARVTEEIRQSEALQRFFADSMPALVFTSDHAGRLEFVNSRWSDYFGSEYASITDWTALVHREDRRHVANLFRQSIALGERFEVECRLRSQRGTFRWHLCKAEPMRGPDGGVQRWFGTLTDVHDQFERERILSSLTTLIDATRDLRSAAEIAGLTTKVLCGTLGSTACSFGRIRKEDGNMVWIGLSSTGDGFELGDFPAAQRAPEFTDRLLRGEPVPIQDAITSQDLSLSSRNFFLANQIRSLLYVPLIHQGDLVAVMQVFQSEPREWTPEDIRLVKVVSERCLTETLRVESAEAIYRSETRFRELLEAATIGIIVNDSRGVFTFANRPLLEMLGYSEDDVKHRRLTWQTIQVPERAKLDDVALAQLMETSRCDPYETEYITKDGRMIPVYVGAALLPGDTGDELVGAAFVTDLSGLKQAQRDLISLNEELDQRVRVRTAELEQAYRDQESYNYSISHDLRSPLRAIVATARMIEVDHGDSLTEGAKALLQRQIESANRLGGLVDDLLNLSRIGRQEMRFGTVDLSALARDVALEFNALDQIDVEPGMSTSGDGTLLRLVLQNLIGNALKFSRHKANIRVGRLHEEAIPTFFVKDEGIGFDMSYAHKLFLPFERLVSDHEFPGTGIGLTNVQKVIDRHLGRVWAESMPGAGATFFFTLPHI